MKILVDGAARFFFQACNQFQQCRFSTTGWSDQGNPLGIGNADGGGAQSYVAFWVNLLQGIEFNAQGLLSRSLHHRVSIRLWKQNEVVPEEIFELLFPK